MIFGSGHQRVLPTVLWVAVVGFGILYAILRVAS